MFKFLGSNMKDMDAKTYKKWINIMYAINIVGAIVFFVAIFYMVKLDYIK